MKKPLFRKLAPVRIFEQVVNQIRDMILNGVFHPGDKLPSEQELERQFSVSRSSIREALRVLEYDGFVEVRRGSGTFVADYAERRNGRIEVARWLEKREDTLQEVLQVREYLEGLNASLAASKADKEKIAKAEAETQKDGSRVIISTGDKVVETKMKKNVTGDIIESEATRASLEAMEKLKEEEEDDKNEEDDDIPPVTEADLPPEEQMGRGATVIEEGADKKVDLVNSAVPESTTAKEQDPFIDRAEKQEIAEIEAKRAEEKKTEVKTEDTKVEENPAPSDELKLTGEESTQKTEDIFAPDDDKESDGKDDLFIEW